VPGSSWSGVRVGDCDADGLIRRSVDPLELMQRVADRALSRIEGAEGALVGLLIDRETLRYVCGAGHPAVGGVGDTLALEDSLAGQAIRAGTPLVTSDERSSVCVPLGRGCEPVGILEVSAAQAHAFDEHDVELLHGLADFMSSVIGAASDFLLASSRLLGARRESACEDGLLDPDGAVRSAARARLEALLAQRRFSLVFQPIFDLATGSAFAFEALARFGRGRAKGEQPDLVLAQAHRLGLGVALEGMLVEGALAHLRRLPRASAMAVNLGPGALLSDEILTLLEDATPRRLVVELTEAVAPEDHPLLIEAVGRLRESGIRLAIDDAGAGFASLMHILKLAPDFIKLDRRLIGGIDRDPEHQCMAGSLRRLAHETGATLIAEGVETAADLGVLRDLGVGAVQGFHLARPARIGAVAQVSRRGAEKARGGRSAARLPRSREGAHPRVAAARP
jgi:EAL domain-containing protein (putative c-di-GMP-specific phosphodiesterase class I)